MLVEAFPETLVSLDLLMKDKSLIKDILLLAVILLSNKLVDLLSFVFRLLNDLINVSLLSFWPWEIIDFFVYRCGELYIMDRSLLKSDHSLP